MSEVISSEEAQQIAIGVATAMLQGDKEARESVYADLTAEDLQKTLRWTTRWLLTHMALLCQIQGIPLEEAWSAFAMMVNYSIENGDSE